MSPYQPPAATDVVAAGSGEQTMTQLCRLAFQFLGSLQPRLPYPIRACMLRVDPMPSGELLQSLDHLDIDHCKSSLLSRTASLGLAGFERESGPVSSRTM
jgi:hypothetical protein